MISKHAISDFYEADKRLFYLPSPFSPSWVLYANSKTLLIFLNLPEHL